MPRKRSSRGVLGSPSPSPHGSTCPAGSAQFHLAPSLHASHALNPQAPEAVPRPQGPASPGHRSAAAEPASGP